jgi:hypothetical protein
MKQAELEKMKRTPAWSFFWALARSVSRWLPRVIFEGEGRLVLKEMRSRVEEEKKVGGGGAFVAGAQKGLSPRISGPGGNELPFFQFPCLSRSGR